jgi:small subunit ribosomal protein S18
LDTNKEQVAQQNENKEVRPFVKKVVRKRKQCPFCTDKSRKISCKDFMRLRRFISERAKILPRRATGVCALHQRDLSLAIKRARILSLLPYTNA